MLFPKATFAITSVNTFQITSDSAQQTQPLIFKNLVAYTNHGGTQSIDIWGYNLRTKENFPLIEKVGQQFITDLEESLIIYEDVEELTLTSDVRAYNYKTGQDILIAGGEGSQGSGVTNGRGVLYIEGGGCGALYFYNHLTGERKQIFDSTCYPKVSGNIAVFTATDPNGTNLKGYNLVTNELFDIATADGFQETPDISEDKVTYLQRFSGTYGDYNSITVKNLRTGEERIVYESTTNTLNNPVISERFVVWSESSAIHVNGVMAADLVTGEVFEVQEQGPHQNSHTSPSIWKNRAVWMSFRTGNGDIYGSILKETDLVPPSCLQPPSGIISWWTGDGNANDIKGVNNGNLLNGVTFASGMVGQAFSFDGIDDFMQAPTNNLPTDNIARTLEMWVKINQFLDDTPNPSSPLETFFAGYGNFGSSGQMYSMGTAGNVYYFSQWGSAIFGPSLVKDRWYHVAVTNIGDLATLYLDGVVVANGTISINTLTGTQFYIGRAPGSYGDIRRLNGFVDEVSVYNRALTAEEIKTIYDAGTNGKCK